MKTIIAPTDFSANSLNAVDYAADMANMLGAHLTLFHVYAIPTPATEVPIPTYDVEALAIAADAEIQKLKETLLNRLNDRVIIHTETRPGYVINELTEYADSVKPFAVVMGAESAGAFERFLFGGKTVTAVKDLAWPLIIVPPTAKFTNIRKAGLACDFRVVVDSVRVQEIKELVKEFNAELHILHVSDKTQGTFSAVTVEESGLLQEMLGDLHPQYHFLNAPEVEKSVTDFAEENKLDLLILIPKRHSLVSKIFQHSHSKQLVLHTHVPVMSLHETPM
ncbi:universal stress protein [Terrimonas pollutisoli]|uniref:universal stress protein n=1 Tax=Terrimonas pollutisoli TaxID=3034147 RepID=UPI0023EAE1C1|nr:universal stress protein [Terrimonas sp. H1YJ31]